MAKDKIIKGLLKADEATDKAAAAAKAAPKKTDTFIGRHLSGPAIKEKIKQRDITAPYKGYEMADPSSLKKGGTVKKTGLALVHKGEKVLTKSQVKKGKGR